MLIIPLLQNFPLEGKLCLNPVFTFPSRGWAFGGKFLCFFPLPFPFPFTFNDEILCTHSENTHYQTLYPCPPKPPQPNQVCQPPTCMHTKKHLEPGRGKNCSHCSFQNFHSLSKENQVCLVRTFLSDPGSESKISRLGGWGWKNDPECFVLSQRMLLLVQCGHPDCKAGFLPGIPV